MPTLTLPDFVNKWRSTGLTERAGAQMHFIELCDVLGEPHPASEDFSGATYTFEKGGTTIEGVLAADPTLQAGFMESMSLEGIKLAVSSSGGSAGNRKFPLMSSLQSWESLEKRSMTIAVQDDARVITRLLETLAEAVFQTEDAGSVAKLRDVIGKVCREARDRWDEGGVELNHRELARFCRASEVASPLPKIPDLTASWNHVAQTFARYLEHSKDQGYLGDPDELK
jgi:hypothetical protein